MNAPIQTAAFWDQSADGYIASAEPFTALFCADALGLAAIEPGMTLLDVATGPGALALAAARAGAVVTAIDFSQTMVDRLNGRIDGLPIEAHRMDGQALDLPDARFDRACSVFGVPLFPDWRAGLREMARVLKPGGRAVVAVGDNAYGFGPNLLLARARAHVTGLPAPVEIIAWETLADPQRLAGELRDAGLVAIEIHERTHDFMIDAALFATRHPMILNNPVLAGLAEAERDAVIAAAMVDAQRHGDANVLRLPGTARFAIGTRDPVGPDLA
jgi:SAM-dependent methyltransferase